MNLDFSAIRGDTAADILPEAPVSQNQSFSEGRQGNIQEQGTGLELSQFRATPEAPKGEKQAARLAIIYRTEQQELERAREVYRGYQDNIKAAGDLRSDILKGLKAGEPTECLLLKACNIISLMTGDTVFNTQVERDLVSIYGEQAGSEKPLEYELEQVQKRLCNMQKAMEKGLGNPDDKRRIAAAIAAHKAEESRIIELISR